MKKTNIIFWNVDTQIDFVESYGKLCVPGANLLKKVWANITAFAEKNKIRVVNTADFHNSDSKELSLNPDYTNTFPEHCLANTKGAEYISETSPHDPILFRWDKIYTDFENISNKRNIVIQKDAFDVFMGNPNTENIVKFLAPKMVVVYGVATNVCVNDAVVGLTKRVEQVFVIEDAIKELPNIPLPFDNWKKLGVMMISHSELALMLEQ